MCDSVSTAVFYLRLFSSIPEADVQSSSDAETKYPKGRVGGNIRSNLGGKCSREQSHQRMTVYQDHYTVGLTRVRMMGGFCRGVARRAEALPKASVS